MIGIYIITQNFFCSKLSEINQRSLIVYVERTAKSSKYTKNLLDSKIYCLITYRKPYIQAISSTLPRLNLPISSCRGQTCDRKIRV